MQNILVTGGCGFIGSHIALGLLKKGYNVTILDSNVNSSRLVIDRIRNLYFSENPNKKCNLNFFKGDILNEILIDNIFQESINKEQKIKAVIHLAGLKSVKESILNPIKYWENNFLGSLNLLKVMIKYSCFELVYSSSATVYGHPNTIPILENNFTNPINPYGKTKLAVEFLIKDVFQKYSDSFKVIVLRYFNPIGAHESGLIGENYKYCSDNIFPNILKVALKKEKFLKIFGNDWNTLDGTTERDYIHVMDLADGHISSLKFLENSRPNIHTLNIGSGCKTSILNLIKLFERLNNIEIPYKFYNRRFGDTPVLLANNDLARKLLRWETKKTLSDMCKDGWNFAKKNNDFF